MTAVVPHPGHRPGVDSPYAWLNTGSYLSPNPEMRPGGVGLTFYEVAR